MKKRLYRSYGAYGQNEEEPVVYEKPLSPVTMGLLGAGMAALINGGVWVVTYYASEPKKKKAFGVIATGLTALSTIYVGLKSYQISKEANLYYEELLALESGE